MVPRTVFKLLLNGLICSLNQVNRTDYSCSNPNYKLRLSAALDWSANKRDGLDRTRILLLALQEKGVITEIEELLMALDFADFQNKKIIRKLEKSLQQVTRYLG